jgi:hypothetical protein
LWWNSFSALPSELIVWPYQVLVISNWQALVEVEPVGNRPSMYAMVSGLLFHVLPPVPPGAVEPMDDVVVVLLAASRISAEHAMVPTFLMVKKYSFSVGVVEYHSRVTSNWHGVVLVAPAGDRPAMKEL